MPPPTISEDVAVSQGSAKNDDDTGSIRQLLKQMDNYSRVKKNSAHY